jgi:hypothetical protein
MSVYHCSKDPDKLNSQFQYILVIDDNTSLKDIEDVLVQALIYRFIVFLYEVSPWQERKRCCNVKYDHRTVSLFCPFTLFQALFIAAPFPCTAGGATLGKYMMGITVISYPSLTPIEGQNLRRFAGNAKRLSLWQ